VVGKIFLYFSFRFSFSGSQKKPENLSSNMVKYEGHLLLRFLPARVRQNLLDDPSEDSAGPAALMILFCFRKNRQQCLAK
jgi:hypothetical protein